MASQPHLGDWCFAGGHMSSQIAYHWTGPLGTSIEPFLLYGLAYSLIGVIPLAKLLKADLVLDSDHSTLLVGIGRVLLPTVGLEWTGLST